MILTNHHLVITPSHHAQSSHPVITPGHQILINNYPENYDGQILGRFRKIA